MSKPFVPEDIFYAENEIQLTSVGLPKSLWKPLYEKIRDSVFDAGNVVQFAENEGALAVTPNVLVAKSSIKANSDVYLIDHAWSTTLSEAREVLRRSPESLKRVRILLGLDEPEDAGDEEEEEEQADETVEKTIAELSKLAVSTPTSFDLENVGLKKLSDLNLPVTHPKLESLSLRFNDLSDVNDVVDTVAQLKSLKAVWLNDNPVSQHVGLADKLLEKNPSLEIIDSKFTAKYTGWAISTVAEKALEDIEELDLSGRGLEVLKTDVLKKLVNLRTIDIRNNKFGNWSGDILPALRALPKLTTLWMTYLSVIDRATVLRNLPALQFLNGASRKEQDERSREDEQLIDEVFDVWWKFNQHYSVARADGDEMASVWYIMDEVGLAIAHSDSPNFIVVPFYSVRTQTAYSIAWPVLDVGVNEPITRNFLPGVETGPERNLRLSVWFPQLHDKPLYEKSVMEHWRKLNTDSPFFSYLKDMKDYKPTYVTDQRVLDANKTTYKVFCNIQLLREAFAKLPNVEIVSDNTQADIAWLYEQVADFSTIPKNQLINQIPGEEAITLKDKLLHTIHDVFGHQASWFPPSFDLQKELLVFAGYYDMNKEAHNNMVTIVKPTNLARGIGHVITPHWECVMRQLELGNRIASRYVVNPMLLDDRKFDLRFMVLVKPVFPLEIYVYQEFYVRMANKPFCLSEYEDYQRHQTVMTFTPFEQAKITHKLFKKMFIKEYTEEVYHEMLGKVHSTVYLALQCAFFEGAMKAQPNAFALYGFDILLDRSVQPLLLEVNYCPNLQRVLEYTPDFARDVLDVVVRPAGAEGAQVGGFTRIAL